MTVADEPENAPIVPTRHEVGSSAALFDRAAAELRGEPGHAQGVGAVPLTAAELRALLMLLGSYPAARPPLGYLVQHLAADIRNRWEHAAGYDPYTTPPGDPVNEQLQQDTDRHAAARTWLATEVS